MHELLHILAWLMQIMHITSESLQMMVISASWLAVMFMRMHAGIKQSATAHG